MNPSGLLFVNHVSTMSGAEFVLAQVAQAFPGASAFLFEPGPLATTLEARGLKTIISRRGGGLDAIKRDKSLLHALPAAGNLAGLVWEIARTAKRHKILYANSQKAFLLTAMAANIVRRPLVWHLHDILDSTHFGGMQRRLQIGLANRVASRVVMPSTACANAFIGAGGKADLVTIIPNGIAQPDPAVIGQASRASLGLPDGPLVGVFSRLARWKGQHVLLEALAKTPGIQAILVGSALFGEDSYERELYELVEKYQLSDRVRFLGQRSDVMQLMAAVDCVVHTSTSPEPFGLTLVEAMTAGTPVIASDAGAASEILEAGRAGVLVPPGDAEALASAMSSYFAAPKALEARIAYAAERARQYYSADRMRTEVSALVSSLADRGPR